MLCVVSSLTFHPESCFLVVHVSSRVPRVHRPSFPYSLPSSGRSPTPWGVSARCPVRRALFPIPFLLLGPPQMGVTVHFTSPQMGAALYFSALLFSSHIETGGDALAGIAISPWLKAGDLPSQGRASSLCQANKCTVQKYSKKGKAGGRGVRKVKVRVKLTS